MSALIFVICGSRNEYNAFLLATLIPEKYTQYATAPHHITGFMPHPRFQVVYYGNYWDNPLFDNEDYEDIVAYLEQLTMFSSNPTQPEEIAHETIPS